MLRVEQLEGRDCPSVVYDFDLLTSLSLGGHSAIDEGVSINNSGYVAFKAHKNVVGEAVFVARGPGSVQQVSFDPDLAPPFRDYSRVASINNMSTPEIAATDDLNGGLLGRVRRWLDDGNPNSHNFINVDDTLGEPGGVEDDFFDKRALDINDNGEVVYVGVDTSFGPFQNLRV